MGAISKANNLDSLSAGTSWVGGVVPNSDTAAKWDSTFTFNNTSVITSGNVAYGNIWIDSAAVAQVVIDSGASGGNSVQTRSKSGNGVPSDRSIYVAPNKTLSGNFTLAFLNTYTTSHDVEVGSGGALIPGNRIVGAVSGAGTSGVVKYGAGTMWFNRASTSPGTGAITFLTIREGSITVAGNTVSNPIGTGPITFNDTGSGNPTLQYASYSGSSCTLGNTVVMTTDGTINVPSGFAATITGAFSGSGTLTVSGAGTLTASGGISCPLILTGSGLVTAAVFGATLSGTAPLSTNGFSADAPNYTGIITGTGFNYTVSGTKSNAGQINGSFNIPASGGAGTLTLSNTNSTGYFIQIYGDASNPKTLILTGKLLGNSGGTSYISSAGTITLSGASAQLGAATLQLGDNSVVGPTTFSLVNGATGTSNLVFQSTTSGVLSADSSSSNAHSGNITCNTAVTISVAAGGTLSLTGASQTITGSGPTKSGTGILKVTGGLTCSPLMTVSAGKLYLNTTSTTTFTNGVSVSGGAELACNSPTPGAYAANITGNVTLAANATFRFASAPTA